MSMLQYRVESLRVVFKAFLSSDHVTPATGKTIAIVISKQGGAFANPAAGATNATEISVGWYYVDLGTSDTNTNGTFVVRGTEGTIDPVEVIYKIQDAPYIRRSTAAAGAAGSITLDASASASNDFYNNTLIRIVSGTGSGQSRIITDYVGSTQVATVGENWITNPDNTSVFEIYPSGAAVADVNVASIDATPTNDIRDAIFAKAHGAAMANLTFEELINLMSAVLLGKVSGMDIDNPVFKNLADTADMVEATTDADGNRTAVTLTP